MKAFISVLVLAVSALVAAPLAGADPSNPPQDQVMGHGVIAQRSDNHFEFNARSGPNGEDPHGDAHVFDNTTKDGTDSARFQGDVTCLRVAGNRASFVVQYTSTKNRGGDGSVFVVEDNGNPPGQESLDRISISGFSGAPPPCPDPTLAVINGLVTQGDIEVRDAS